MDTSEVMHLGDWYEAHVPSVTKAYQELNRIIQHNATQPNKLPLREKLNMLLGELKNMPLERLSTDQKAILGQFNALQYLGDEGAAFVTATVTSSEYDPAAAAADIANALDQIGTMHRYLNEAVSGLATLGFSLDSISTINPDHAMIRVRFQNEAAITDVQLLKKWASEWFDIARGVSIAVGESPNDVKVVGASNGSIIITLLASSLVTMLLARMAKHVSAIALDIVKVQSAIEDLRYKKILNNVIEEQLKQRQKKIEEDGIDEAFDQLFKSIGSPDGDTHAVLKKSLEKLNNFTGKGGDIDFVVPLIEEQVTDATDEDTNSAGEDIKSLASQAKQLQSIVHEIRTQNAETRRLTHQPVA